VYRRAIIEVEKADRGTAALVMNPALDYNFNVGHFRVEELTDVLAVFFHGKAVNACKLTRKKKKKFPAKIE
jgi:hypothetical protein